MTFNCIANEVGRLMFNKSHSEYEYIFDLKDHLGNVRLSFKADSMGKPAIVQQDHYYPFGMRLAGLSEDAGNDNKYLYNSKELEDYQDLQWYHYGARYYDPQLGRWLQVDPVDEFFSPYTYGPNNPINGIDPNGMFWQELGNYFRFGVWVDNETIAQWECEIINNPDLAIESGTPYANYYDYSKRQMELVGDYYQFALNQIDDNSIVDYYAFASLWTDMAEMTKVYIGTSDMATMLAGMAMKGALAAQKIIKYTDHGLAQANQIGFTPDRVTEIINNGQSIQVQERYGLQTKYTLNGNTVVISNNGQNAGKIITVYSNNHERIFIK